MDYVCEKGNGGPRATQVSPVKMVPTFPSLPPENTSGVILDEDAFNRARARLATIGGREAHQARLAKLGFSREEIDKIYQGYLREGWIQPL